MLELIAALWYASGISGYLFFAWLFNNKKLEHKDLIIGAILGMTGLVTWFVGVISYAGLKLYGVEFKNKKK